MQATTPESVAFDRRGQRADDVLAIHRLARQGGTESLLRWLAGRTGAQVLLIGADGMIVARHSDDELAAHTELARRGAAEMRSRGLASFVLDTENSTLHVLPLNGAQAQAGPVLVTVTPRPAPNGLPLLLADASSALDLCWRTEHAEEQQRRVELAETRNRAAVLHLLMNNHVSTARQIADVLEPALPNTLRFHVVESAPHLRHMMARRFTSLAPRAWVVPCPVYDDHVLVLAPASPGAPAEESLALASAMAQASADCVVGVSETLPLRETATGYAQAFHALVTARSRTSRWATFAHRPDPAIVIGPAARAWAAQMLAPLRTHLARRPQDPDGAELAATAASWLAFSSQATAHLKIHRNTLSARLRHIETLLLLDLDRLTDQSLLALALRADNMPQPAEPTARNGMPAHTLDDLLTGPAVVEWAHHVLRPVEELPESTGLAHTLDTWLRHDARIVPTAAELSLSTTAVRKRLARLEELLERSLLRPPSDCHELWLARHVLSLAQPALHGSACRCPIPDGSTQL